MIWEFSDFDYLNIYNKAHTYIWQWHPKSPWTGLVHLSCTTVLLCHEWRVCFLHGHSTKIQLIMTWWGPQLHGLVVLEDLWSHWRLDDWKTATLTIRYSLTNARYIRIYCPKCSANSSLWNCWLWVGWEFVWFWTWFYLIKASEHL